MKGISAYMGSVKLAGLLILLPLLVYSWGIRRTVELNRTVREQALRIESAQAGTTPGTFWQNEPVGIDRGSGEAVKTGVVLHRITSGLEKHGATAERYTPYRLYSEAENELYAGELLLGGGFASLTRLLDELETEGKERIVSVTYRSAVLPENRKKQLQMTVVFQQITQTE